MNVVCIIFKFFGAIFSVINFRKYVMCLKKMHVVSVGFWDMDSKVCFLCQSLAFLFAWSIVSNRRVLLISCHLIYFVSFYFMYFKAKMLVTFKIITIPNVLVKKWNIRNTFVPSWAPSTFPLWNWLLIPCTSSYIGIKSLNMYNMMVCFKILKVTSNCIFWQLFLSKL